MKREVRDWLEDFVLKAQAAQDAVNRLLEVEMMDKANAYHPSGNAKADGIKARTDELIHYIRTETAASGPLTKGAAEHAIHAYEQASMWAVKALFSADLVEGDDGGAQGLDRTLAKELSDARDLEPPGEEAP